MNSSDEEKQLQLITSLKEQGRRARGRQVRAAAARGRGRLPGAGFGLRRAGECRGRRAHPAVSSPVRERPPRPARLGEPGAAGKVRVPGAWGPAVREALPAGCLSWRSRAGGRDRDLGRTRTQGTPSHAGEAGAPDVSGGGDLGSPAGPARRPRPHPCTVALGGLPRSFAAFPAFQSASV